MRRRLLLLCSAIVALQLLLRLDWFATRDADVELVVTAVAAVVDEQFVCATLDLWPPEKCRRSQRSTAAPCPARGTGRRRRRCAWRRRRSCL